VRVALVTHRFPPYVGGVENCVFSLARELTHQGVEVEVLTQGSRQSVADGKGAGYRVRTFRELIPSSAYPVAPGLWRWLSRNQESFDVIHGHNYHGIAALGASLLNRPFVLTPYYHGPGHTPLAKAVHLGYRYIGGVELGRSDAIICITSAEADHLVRDQPRARGKVKVVPITVEVELIRATAGFLVEMPVVLSVGRLTPHKRVEVTVEAMSLLGDSVQFVVVGDGPERASVEALSERLGVDARFVGEVADQTLRRWLRTADVMVACSERESFGMTVLEGLVAGARLVATDIPAHREVVRTSGAEGSTIFVSRDPTAEEVAAAVATQLVRGSRTERELSIASRTWNEVARLTMDIYENVLQNPNSHKG